MPQSCPVVAVSATFTAEPLSLPIEFWMRRLGLELPVKFAPYNQIFQQLLDPASLLAQNRGGINVVLVRFEDWVRYRTVEPLSVETLEETVRYLVSCLRLAAESFSSPLLVSVCPSSPGFLDDPEQASFALSRRPSSRLSIQSACRTTPTGTCSATSPTRPSTSPLSAASSHARSTPCG